MRNVIVKLLRIASTSRILIQSKTRTPNQVYCLKVIKLLSHLVASWGSLIELRLWHVEFGHEQLQKVDWVLSKISYSSNALTATSLENA